MMSIYVITYEPSMKDDDDIDNHQWSVREMVARLPFRQIDCSSGRSKSKYTQIHLQVQYSTSKSTSKYSHVHLNTRGIINSGSPSTSRSTSALSALMVTIIPLGQSLFRFIFQPSFYFVGFNGHNDHNDEKHASVSLDIISDLSLSIDSLNDQR